MAGLPDPVVQHLETHLQVVSRRHLIRSMGYTNATVQGWLRRHHLELLVRGVVGLPGVPLTFDRRAYAAVLRREGQVAGPFATLALFGVEKFTACPEIDVLPRAGLPGIDCTTYAQVVPTLSVTRALIEVAPTVPRKRLRVGFDDARRKGLSTVEHMRRRAKALGSEVLLELLDGGALDPESEGERDLQAFLADVFPDEEIEWGVEDLVPGRRLDAAIRRLPLGFEYDSRDFHVDREPDYIRDLECGAAGVQVIRLSSGMLRYRREETKQHLLEVADRLKGAPAHLTGR